MTAARPSGTVTFLFTDIEGSTRLWDEHPEAMRTALTSHDAAALLPGNSAKGATGKVQRIGLADKLGLV